MTKFLFFLTVLFTSLVLAQEATADLKTEVSRQTETVSSLQPTTPSPAAVPSAEPAANPQSDTNSSVPSVPTPTLPVTETAAPVDPSAEAAPGLASPPAPLSSEEAAAAGIEPTAPTSEQPVEPLKPSQEKPSESVARKEEEIKVRYYQLRARIENDPEVAAIKKQANTAVSDEKKRQALKAYYELLFKKMKSVDASISERCDIMQAAYLRRLEQVSLEPTIPLTPLESPSSGIKKKEVTSSEPTSGTIKKKKRHS